jgi:subtilase family serine protease
VKEKFMKVKNVFALLFVVMIVLSVKYFMPVLPASAAKVKNEAVAPNLLEIQRTPALSSGQIANVAQPQLVQAIYQNVLSLPTRPTNLVCPNYITAQFQLTFLHGGSSVLMATAQQGGCALVELKGSVHVANSTFWVLLNDAGVLNNVQPAVNMPGGLGPNDLQNAYALPSATAGAGQTVAIVDANDDPRAEQDMGTYRKAFGLAACTTANGCFKKVSQSGSTRYPSPDQGWSGEISLDLDMVSAICPKCRILLVEANTASFGDLGTAVNTAVRLRAVAVSNSYGASEDGQTAQSAASYYNHPGVIITASAGDSGYGVQLPAAFKNVIAVGGTSLSRASNARGWTESAWDGSGSGCSQYIGKAIWQLDQGCKGRTVGDVSAVADPATGVAVYNTYGGYGWTVYGGTSASSPIIASVFALAGNATLVNAAYVYRHTANLNLVTQGSNGDCGGIYLCTSGQGYSGPTGWGTPNGVGAF